MNTKLIIAADRGLLAASAPIHKQLVDALNPKARAKISQLLASNLAKAEPNELLAHFARAAS